MGLHAEKCSGTCYICEKEGYLSRDCEKTEKKHEKTETKREESLNNINGETG